MQAMSGMWCVTWLLRQMMCLDRDLCNVSGGTTARKAAATALMQPQFLAWIFQHLFIPLPASLPPARSHGKISRHVQEQEQEPAAALRALLVPCGPMPSCAPGITNQDIHFLQGGCGFPVALGAEVSSLAALPGHSVPSLHTRKDARARLLALRQRAGPSKQPLSFPNPQRGRGASRATAPSPRKRPRRQLPDAKCCLLFPLRHTDLCAAGRVNETLSSPNLYPQQSFRACSHPGARSSSAQDDTSPGTPRGQPKTVTRTPVCALPEHARAPRAARPPCSGGVEEVLAAACWILCTTVLFRLF